MASLVIDKIEDASYDETTVSRRLVRKAQVHDIDTGTASGYMIRALEMAGLPRLRDRHPEKSDLFLQRRFVRALPSGNAVEIDLEYEPNIVTGYNPGTLIFRTRTALTSEVAESMLLPSGGGQAAGLYPFSILTNVGNSTVVTQGKMQRLTPQRQIDVECILTNPPPENIADGVGTVNQKRWCGKPPGYWMATRVDVGSASDTPGQYSLGLSFLTRSIRNWCEWDFARDQLGKPMATDAAKAQAFPFITRVYEFGINNTIPGIVIAGQYYPEDYRQLFGFDSQYATSIQLSQNNLFQFGYSYASLPSAR